MGGGDLNLKKSWHPHTIKNQEKVWKAEQAKSQEEKKLNDLRKEIEEEKTRDELKRIGRESGILARENEGDKKLDWMYKSSTDLINREEYLLGRKIDKSFEILQAEEKEKEQKNLVGVKQPLNHVEHDCVPFSIRAYKNLENSEQVDLQRKVMEDPLMLIKQREMESRRKILENPVKLKELHRILKTDEKLQKVSKKSKKTKKSKKKYKKRRKSTSPSPSSSDSNSADLDTKLAKKLKAGFFSKEDPSNLGLQINKLLDTKLEKISKELLKSVGEKKKKKNKSNSDDSDTVYSSREKKNYKSRESRSSPERRQLKNEGRKSRSVSRSEDIKLNRYKSRELKSSIVNYISEKKYRRSRDDRKRSRSHSRNMDEKRIKYGHRSRAHSREREIRKSKEKKSSTSTRNRCEEYNIKSQDSKKFYRSRSKSPTETTTRTQSRSQRGEGLKHSSTHRSDKLTEKEKESKLKEMMSNATWREGERTEVVRKYREAQAMEEECYRTREYDKSFLNNEVKKAMENQTTVGTRLRANLNNIQRNSAAMNTNFARK